MIQVKFVEGSRTLLRLVVEPPQADPALARASHGADLLFSVLNGKMPALKAAPPVAAPVAAASPAAPSLSSATLQRLQSLRQLWKLDRAIAA